MWNVWTKIPNYLPIDRINSSLNVQKTSNVVLRVDLFLLFSLFLLFKVLVSSCKSKKYFMLFSWSWSNGFYFSLINVLFSDYILPWLYLIFWTSKIAYKKWENHQTKEAFFLITSPRSVIRSCIRFLSRVFLLYFPWY